MFGVPAAGAGMDVVFADKVCVGGCAADRDWAPASASFNFTIASLVERTSSCGVFGLDLNRKAISSLEGVVLWSRNRNWE